MRRFRDQEFLAEENRGCCGQRSRFSSTIKDMKALLHNA